MGKLQKLKIMLDFRLFAVKSMKFSLTQFSKSRYKCIKENGPSYISNLFDRRKFHCILRNKGCNIGQPSYNHRFYHNSFTYYKLSHLWNQLPLGIKQWPNLSRFFRKKSVEVG